MRDEVHEPHRLVVLETGDVVVDRLARMALDPFHRVGVFVVGVHPLMAGGSAAGTPVAVLYLPDESVDPVLFGPDFLSWRRRWAS